MSDGAAPTAYLVIRRDDGFGDIYPLLPGQRHTMGRSTTNRFVLKDELCSREHAEVYEDEGKWCLRDLNSLNGTRVNGEILNAREWELSVNDEVSLGRTNLVFIEDLSQLANLPATAPLPGASVKIKKRLGQTRFLMPGASESATDSPTDRHHLGHDLALLYRLALDMGAASSYQDLAHIVLDGLFEAIPADVGAVLSAKTNKELEISVHRHRDKTVLKYHKVSQFLSSEVMSTKEAVLAEDVSRDRHLRSRESLTELGATSVICAPVVHGTEVLGLIHLYCTDPSKALDTDDLEFAVAVAKQFGNAIHNLLRQDSLTLQNQTLRDQLKVESELVGKSAAIKGVETQIGRVADTNATVLIRGESGVGKELVARAIHNSSSRKDGPIICLNCAALTETLLESELFGHEKGAFTGATERMVGKFEAAHHGTIFLDEIGEMNLNTQAKLLRVLEGHPFERVGGHTPIRVEVRVVAATNKPLEQGLQDGTFRRDLFFRLQVVEIRVPPLRERIEDVPILAEHFLKRFVRETGRKIKGFDAEAMRKMEAYHWPGNVRELRNVIERAVALSTGPMLGRNDIWLSLEKLDAPLAAAVPLASNHYQPLTLEELEKAHILRTLEHTDWNKSAAASILSIERSTLDRKIKSFELKRE